MHEAASDETLVELVQQGDKQAFAQLIARYEGLARRIAFRMMGDADLARDLAQEAILQAYLSLDKLRQHAQFQSWLYGIVLNVCRNYRRSQKMKFLSLDALAGGLAFDALPFTSRAPDPHTVAEMQELHAHVLAAVETLSPKNREATLLFYYEGLSHQEIATSLGISVPAVKGRLHKARLYLRDALLAALGPVSGSDLLSERKAKMIRVTVADVVTQEESGHCVVVLMDAAGTSLLPIWIGPFEAEWIALRLLNQPVPRPLTYDFTAKLLQAAAVHLEEVRIETLQESTFYAVAKIQSDGTVHEIDARPSDAIALALRMDRPIFVAQEVMARAGEAIPAEYQRPPLRKGLEFFAQQIAQRQKEFAQQMAAQEAAQATQAQAEQAAKRRQLLTYLFGEG